MDRNVHASSYIYLLNNTADYKNKLLKQLHETGGSEQNATDGRHDELLNKRATRDPLFWHSK